MTEEERLAKQREYNRRWKEAHPGYQTEYMKKYRQEHREEWNARCREYQARHRKAQQKRMNDYHETKKGRATNLLNSYVQADLERRGVRPDLTQEDIMKKCFEPGCKCVYCGETDWHLLGLDRVDNDCPHDNSNTICACRKCNTKRYLKNVGEYLASLGFTSMDEWVEFNNGKYCDYITIRYPDDE